MIADWNELIPEISQVRQDLATLGPEDRDWHRQATKEFYASNFGLDVEREVVQYSLLSNYQMQRELVEDHLVERSEDFASDPEQFRKLMNQAASADIGRLVLWMADDIPEATEYDITIDDLAPLNWEVLARLFARPIEVFNLALTMRPELVAQDDQLAATFRDEYGPEDAPLALWYAYTNLVALNCMAGSALEIAVRTNVPYDDLEMFIYAASNLHIVASALPVETRKQLGIG